jgi:hypothetical protein
MNSSSVVRWCVLLTLWLGFGDSANATIEIVGETHVTFSWNASAGPVAGYYVYVARNGALANFHSLVTDGNSVTIHGDFGDTLRVSTAAFDGDGISGPRSDPSDKVHFVEVAAPTPLPKLPVDDPPASEEPPPADPPDGDPLPAPYEGPAMAYDFNGDGHSDILLRNASIGEQEYWQMHGTEISASIPLPTVDPGWRIAGTGDFDSDGTTDLLWSDTDSGSLYIWFMGDPTADGELGFALEPGWAIAGVGDFDGDDRSEIAIGNESSQFEIWGMGSDFVRVGAFPLRRGWKLAGIGDVDGDGDDDFIVQDEHQKRIEAVLMSVDFSMQRILLDKQPAAMWNVIDSADYDGDGQSDLLWRDLSQDGRGGAGVWHLPDDLHLSGIPLVLSLGSDLTVEGSADYDGDGSADLLVLDPATGQLAIWLMDTTGIHGSSSLGTLAAGWLPVGFAADGGAADR